RARREERRAAPGAAYAARRLRAGRSVLALWDAGLHRERPSAAGARRPPRARRGGFRMSAAVAYRVTRPRRPGLSDRSTLIYKRWKDMQSRCKGLAPKRSDLYAGLRNGSADFHEFRAFAIANGFSKVNNSPD